MHKHSSLLGFYVTTFYVKNVLLSEQQHVD